MKKDIRQKKYDNFVEEAESKIEFPGDKKTQQSPMKRKSKSPAKLVHEQPDAKIDREADNFESSMNKKKKFKKANDEDAPEEMSAKIKLKLYAKKNKLKRSHIIAQKQGQRPKVLMVDGVEGTRVHFQGNPIKNTDADNLLELRKMMSNKGISLTDLKRGLQTLRRKSERTTSRLNKICYQCRKPGHLLSNCPEVSNSASPIETVRSGICYKCGSTKHSHLKCHIKTGYKFATCFICREQGHIARECPDKPNPREGSCKLCGDVTHLKNDCPKARQENLSNELVVGTIAETDDIESLDDAPKTPEIQCEEQKIVVF